MEGSHGRIEIYKAGSWPEFLEHKEEWLGADSPVAIVPAPADKSRLIGALPELRPDDLFTIPELIDRYLRNRWGKGLISIHTAESILGSIVGDNRAILGLSWQATGLRGEIVYGNQAGEQMRIPHRKFVAAGTPAGAGEEYRTEFPLA